MLYSGNPSRRRAKPSQVLYVDDAELACSCHTTMATRLAVRILDLKCDGRLAITDCEYASTREIRSTQKSIIGVHPTNISTWLDANFSPDYYVEQMTQPLTTDHRLLIMGETAKTDGRACCSKKPAGSRARWSPPWSMAPTQSSPS